MDLIIMQNKKRSASPAESDFPIDIEQLLLSGHTIQIKPQGYSMYPLFLPGRDEALIKKDSFSKLRRGDVVLYRRDQGPLVLHRICRINQSGIYMVGDNQTEIEGPLRRDQIRGRLIGLIRNGRYISVKNPLYLAFSRIWLFLRPFRPALSKAASGLLRYFS